MFDSKPVIVFAPYLLANFWPYDDGSNSGIEVIDQTIFKHEDLLRKPNIHHVGILLRRNPIWRRQTEQAIRDCFTHDCGGSVETFCKKLRTTYQDLRTQVFYYIAGPSALLYRHVARRLPPGWFQSVVLRQGAIGIDPHELPLIADDFPVDQPWFEACLRVLSDSIDRCCNVSRVVIPAGMPDTTKLFRVHFNEHAYYTRLREWRLRRARLWGNAEEVKRLSQDHMLLLAPCIDAFGQMAKLAGKFMDEFSKIADGTIFKPYQQISKPAYSKLCRLFDQYHPDKHVLSPPAVKDKAQQTFQAFSRIKEQVEKPFPFAPYMLPEEIERYTFCARRRLFLRRLDTETHDPYVAELIKVAEARAAKFRHIYAKRITRAVRAFAKKLPWPQGQLEKALYTAVALHYKNTIPKVDAMPVLRALHRKNAEQHRDKVGGSQQSRDFEKTEGETTKSGEDTYLSRFDLTQTQVKTLASDVVHQFCRTHPQFAKYRSVMNRGLHAHLDQLRQTNVPQISFFDAQCGLRRDLVTRLIDDILSESSSPRQHFEVETKLLQLRPRPQFSIPASTEVSRTDDKNTAGNVVAYAPWVIASFVLGDVCSAVSQERVKYSADGDLNESLFTEALQQTLAPGGSLAAHKAWLDKTYLDIEGQQAGWQQWWQTVATEKLKRQTLVYAAACSMVLYSRAVMLFPHAVVHQQAVARYGRIQLSESWHRLIDDIAPEDFPLPLLLNFLEPTVSSKLPKASNSLLQEVDIDQAIACHRERERNRYHYQRYLLIDVGDNQREVRRLAQCVDGLDEQAFLQGSTQIPTDTLLQTAVTLAYRQAVLTVGRRSKQKSDQEKKAKRKQHFDAYCFDKTQAWQAAFAEACPRLSDRGIQQKVESLANSQAGRMAVRQLITFQNEATLAKEYTRQRRFESYFLEKIQYWREALAETWPKLSDEEIQLKRNSDHYYRSGSFWGSEYRQGYEAFASLRKQQLSAYVWPTMPSTPARSSYVGVFFAGRSRPDGTVVKPVLSDTQMPWVLSILHRHIGRWVQRRFNALVVNQTHTPTELQTTFAMACRHARGMDVEYSVLEHSIATLVHFNLQVRDIEEIFRLTKSDIDQALAPKALSGPEFEQLKKTFNKYITALRENSAETSDNQTFILRNCLTDSGDVLDILAFRDIHQVSGYFEKKKSARQWDAFLLLLALDRRRLLYASAIVTMAALVATIILLVLSCWLAGIIVGGVVVGLLIGAAAQYCCDDASSAGDNASFEDEGDLDGDNCWQSPRYGLCC